MRLFLVLQVITVLTLASCKVNKQPLESNTMDDRMPICNVEPGPKAEMVRAISTFSNDVLIIEKGDTISVQGYSFILEDDSLSVARAFYQIEIPQILMEMRIAGRTSLSTTMYTDSTFSPTTVVRGISPYYHSVQQQIDRKLAGFRLASPPEDSIELIFSHRLELETY